MRLFAQAKTTRKTLVSGVVIAGVSALVLSGCAPSLPTLTNSRADEICGTEVIALKEITPVAPPTALTRDVTLKLGSILPQTGTLAFLGPPEIAGVDLAVAEINASVSGVLGGNVSVAHRDSGDGTTEIAITSATELLSLGVAGIIGAASSGVSKTFIDQVTGAGVIHFSPANTSPDFSDYDDDGYYWRTAPSDVLQGRVIGQKIVGDGNQRIGVLYLNDPYGKGLYNNAKIAIESAGAEVVAAVTFNTGDNVVSAQVDEVLAATPDAILLIAFDETKSIMPELSGTKQFDASQVYFVDGNLADYSESFAEKSLNCAVGTLPGVLASDEQKARLLGINPDLGTEFSYANESYDAVIHMALAAIQGGSVEPEVIRDNLESVSKGGEKCDTFAKCVELIAAGKDIDYEGASGPITFDENGDPTEAYVGIYQFGSTNKNVGIDVEFGQLD
jgi:branched-chain amino acid transport system substrate-binding protein